MIDLSHLRYVVATAELGSFNRAAETFRMKQATLSQSLRHLELRLGIDLFVRSPRGVELTPAGQSFLSGARRVMDGLDAMAREASAFRSGAKGRLSLGITATGLHEAYETSLLKFSRRHPDVELELVMGRPEDHRRTLSGGSLDAFFLAGIAPPADLSSITLGCDRLVAVFPGMADLSPGQFVYWPDLRGLTILLPLEGAGKEVRAVVSHRLQGIEPRARILARPLSPPVLSQLLERDSLMIIEEASAHALPDTVITRPLHDRHGPSRIDRALVWSSGNANPLLTSFIHILSADDDGARMRDR